MTPQEALAAILNNKFRADAMFRECSLRHQSLSDWISGETP
jgi:hypothetical protein